MSNIYIQEPPSTGKVCLKSTVGDIDIELWSRECPKACRNFVQLCMEGYYNGTIFHRVVRGFIVQGGDPTGTGMGGDSIYGEPFKDEFHSRIRFVRRGLVAMANAGKNDNGSQFFFTLGPAPELQDKHTIFGKVGGDTLFNMLKLGEGEIDKNERPLHPNKIIATEILVNPFPDIEPRVTKRRTDEKREKKPKSQMKAAKNFNLLSFGDEAEEEEVAVEEINKKITAKGKSAHDLLEEVDEKLSSEPAVRPEELTNNQSGEPEDTEETEEASKEKEAVRRRIQDKLKKGKKDKVKVEYGEEEDLEKLIEDEGKSARREEVNSLKAEYKQLQKQMAKAMRKTEEKDEDIKVEETPAQAAYKAERGKYLEMKKTELKRKTASRENETLEMLARFQTKLHAVQEETPSSSAVAEDSDKEEKLEGEEEGNLKDVQGDDWLVHTFDAAEETLKHAKDASQRDDYAFDIYDPRNPMVKRRREEAKKDSKKKKEK